MKEGPKPGTVVYRIPDEVCDDGYRVAETAEAEVSAWVESMYRVIVADKTGHLYAVKAFGSDHVDGPKFLNSIHADDYHPDECRGTASEALRVAVQFERDQLRRRLVVAERMSKLLGIAEQTSRDHQ